MIKSLLLFSTFFFFFFTHKTHIFFKCLILTRYTFQFLIRILMIPILHLVAVSDQVCHLFVQVFPFHHLMNHLLISYHSMKIKCICNVDLQRKVSVHLLANSTGKNKKIKYIRLSTHAHINVSMVEDSRHQNLISWNPSGTSFFVCNATQFAQEVLPEFFKHSNFSSFVRLLNM